ncbi:HAD-IIIA family hydrolase [soil metagenome]
MRPAVFIDKDGTLVDDVPYNVDPAKVTFGMDAFEGLRMLHRQGYLLVVVTNQPGIAMGLFDYAALSALERFLVDALQAEGIPLTGFMACPHDPAVEACFCRKPRPGLLHQAAAQFDIDLVRSWMVGDILNDIEAGHRAGCRTVFMDVGNETEWVRSPLRTPVHSARTLLEAAQVIVAAEAGTLPAPYLPRDSSPGTFLGDVPRAAA